MSNDILDKIEKKKSYYDRSFIALKLALICFVGLFISGILLGYFLENSVIEMILGLLVFIFFGGLLTYGLLGIINSIRSLLRKEDYGARRIVVLIVSLIMLLLPLSMLNIMDIMRVW